MSKLTNSDYEMDCHHAEPQHKFDLHVARYERALMARMHKRCAALFGLQKVEAYEQEMEEIKKRLEAYKYELRMGNFPEPHLAGVGLNYYEPGETYWAATHELNTNRNYMPGDNKHTHIASLAIADMQCLQHEWGNIKRAATEGKDCLETRHIVQIMPTTVQLRFMVDNWPEMFADMNPCTEEELLQRPLEEQQSHAHMKKVMNDPDDKDKLFYDWVKAKRGW